MLFNRDNKKMSASVGILSIFAIWVLFFGLPYFSPVDVSPVTGSGMSPALNNGDVFVVNKTYNQFERFAVITYELSEEQRKLDASKVSKRIGKIVGLPLEYIEITPSEILLNDQRVALLNPEYQNQSETMPRRQIPIDSYFVILDGNLHDLNLPIHSIGVDSRQFGFIQKSAMKRVIKKYDASTLPRSAFVEIIVGGLIICLFIFAHWYIKNNAEKNRLLTSLVVLFYVFFGVALAGGVHNGGFSGVLISMYYKYTYQTPHIIQKELLPTIKPIQLTKQPNTSQVTNCANDDQQKMNLCLVAHYGEVDKTLNEKYNQLIDKFENDDTLNKAQLAWINFRDLTCDYANSISGFSQNSFLYFIGKNKCLIDMTEKRTREFEYYLQYSCIVCIKE